MHWHSCTNPAAGAAWKETLVADRPQVKPAAKVPPAGKADKRARHKSPTCVLLRFFNLPGVGA
jgi:hypothetical protein